MNNESGTSTTPVAEETQQTANSQVTDYAAEIERLRRANDALSSENKRQKELIRAASANTESANAEREQHEAERDKLIESLQKEVAVGKISAKLMGKGFSEADAASIANWTWSIPDEGREVLLNSVLSFTESAKQKSLADIVKNAPTPNGSNTNAAAEDKGVELAKRLGREAADNHASVASAFAPYIKH